MIMVFGWGVSKEAKVRAHEAISSTLPKKLSRRRTVTGGRSELLQYRCCQFVDRTAVRGNS